MSVFNVGLFSGPRYSAFPWSHNNKISMSAGKIIPIAWDFLNTGDKIEADVANVVRLAPMLAPTLDTYRVDVHAFALRLRSLGHVTRDPWSYEDFFNLNKNTAGSLKLPSIPLSSLIAVNGFRNGTLLESLGVPTFKADRERYLEFLRGTRPFLFDPVVGEYLTLEGRGSTFIPASFPTYVVEGSTFVDNSYIGTYDVPSPVSSFSISFCRLASDYSNPIAQEVKVPYRGSLLDYIMITYPAVLGTGIEISWPSSSLSPFFDISGSVYNYDAVVGCNLLDKVYELYNIDAISVMKDYEDWLLDGLFSLRQLDDHARFDEVLSSLVSSGFEEYFAGAYHPFDTYSFFVFLYACLFASLKDELSTLGSVSSPYSYDLSVPVYPFDSYYKIISDWYINTAITDPDSYFTSNSFLVAFNRLKDGDLTKDAYLSVLRSLNVPASRYWANDYFTSAFPSPQAGQAVGIPVNGTIVDLRNANAMQKLKERLLYAGKRFRDVLFAITGHKTSAAILEMSEVLGSWSNVINVDSVLQQSETTSSSPQANYAGIGLGYRSGGKDVRYRADEPTIVMFFASIVPLASYFQGFSKKFMRDNVYDYAIPQLANVGEQKISTAELYVGSDFAPTSDSQRVFGYTRRNGDWMWTPSEIHGDFRGSLDYWHNARVFGSVPRLSTSFLSVNPAEDNLNRVFAVTSDAYDHFYCNFSFTGHIIRSLPKHVHYDL